MDGAEKTIFFKFIFLNKKIDIKCRLYPIFFLKTEIDRAERNKYLIYILPKIIFNGWCEEKDIIYMKL